MHASLDEEARQRLRWEFAVLAAIEHPHLVRVFDLDSADGRPFFTCELCDGPPPTRLTAQPPTERARALCQLLAEVASALEALHRRGLVHRDVKPSNLLTDGAGRTRLGDLGLSSLRGAAGSARGTPGFLAPEALFGSADARADLVVARRHRLCAVVRRASVRRRARRRARARVQDCPTAAARRRSLRASRS